MLANYMVKHFYIAYNKYQGTRPHSLLFSKIVHFLLSFFLVARLDFFKVLRPLQ